VLCDSYIEYYLQLFLSKTIYVNDDYSDKTCQT